MKVMKLILQPLVENAIYHGVGDEEGHIDISVKTDGDFLIFLVTNTGYGISESRIKEIYDTMPKHTSKVRHPGMKQPSVDQSVMKTLFSQS
jgi:sensor histidine kinase YesM